MYWNDRFGIMSILYGEVRRLLWRTDKSVAKRRKPERVDLNPISVLSESVIGIRHSQLFAVTLLAALDWIVSYFSFILSRSY